MDNYSSTQANEALADPNKEKFEQEEQRKYEEWKLQQQEGAKPDEEVGQVSTPQMLTTDEAVKGGQGDHSWKPKESITDKAVKGGPGDHSWGGYEDQQPTGDSLLAKPAKISQEDWDNRAKWVKPLENIVAAGTLPALGVGDFVSDAMALVPFLQPVSDWWNENSPRSNHPAHKAIRDAASVLYLQCMVVVWLQVA